MIATRRNCRRLYPRLVTSPVFGSQNFAARVDGMWHNESVGDTSVVSVGPKGRVVIPAGIRRELGIEEGSELVALVEGEAVVLVPRSAIRSRLRSIFADVGVSMREELIAERRAEAARE
jgi:AbrB family looped-hinge helix DNA binding protein